MPVQNVVPHIQAVAGDVGWWVAHAVKLIPQHSLCPRRQGHKSVMPYVYICIPTWQNQVGILQALYSMQPGMTAQEPKAERVVAQAYSLCKAGLSVSQTTLQYACTQCRTMPFDGTANRRQAVGNTHLGGVGAIRTVKGKVTLDRLTAVLPGAGGDTMVKETSPLAMSSTAAASGTTLMKRARKPDQGHSTLLYSNLTLRYCPGTLVLLKTGAPSKRPALPRTVQLFTVLAPLALTHRGQQTSRDFRSHRPSRVQ